MNELQVVEHYGEVSRVLRHFRPLSADQVAERVIQLYRRHSSEVTGVMDGAIRDHASDIREGKLPATCAILLAIPESYKNVAAADLRELPGAQVAPATPTGRDGSPPPQSHGPTAPPAPDNTGGAAAVDVSRQAGGQRTTPNTRKGDGTLLDQKRLVSFGTAEQYLGISERQRQKLINSGALKVEGQGQNRKITAESLKAYLPPEIPN
jgi:hypothetical protein